MNPWFGDEDVDDIRQKIANKNLCGLEDLFREIVSERYGSHQFYQEPFTFDELMAQLGLLFKLGLHEALEALMNAATPAGCRGRWRRREGKLPGKWSMHVVFFDELGRRDPTLESLATITVDAQGARLDDLTEGLADYIEEHRTWKGEVEHDIWEMLCDPAHETWEADDFPEPKDEEDLDADST